MSDMDTIKWLSQMAIQTDDANYFDALHTIETLQREILRLRLKLLPELGFDGFTEVVKLNVPHSHVDPFHDYDRLTLWQHDATNYVFWCLHGKDKGGMRAEPKIATEEELRCIFEAWFVENKSWLSWALKTK